MDLFPGSVLGIETSCDETSVALLEDGEVLSMVVSSQADLHKKWGGVVPEAAARAHVEAIVPSLLTCLEPTGRSRADSIAVTNRPGLVGALSVGVTAAKTLALVWDIPLIGVHHLEGHILSPLLGGTEVLFPHLCLIVSGGHTESVLVHAPGRYELLGQTIDDAAGEAFDKGGRLLGLGYPGGAAVQQAALDGDPRRYELPRGLRSDPHNFSFSGLKTALKRLVEKEGGGLSVPDAAASLQAAIVDSLTTKSLAALDASGCRAMTLVGGVAANLALRSKLKHEVERRGGAFYTPPVKYCTDNAAMIALAGSYRLRSGEQSDHWMETLANSPLPGIKD